MIHSPAYHEGLVCSRRFVLIWYRGARGGCSALQHITPSFLWFLLRWWFLASSPAFRQSQIAAFMLPDKCFFLSTIRSYLCRIFLSNRAYFQIRGLLQVWALQFLFIFSGSLFAPCTFLQIFSTMQFLWFFNIEILFWSSKLFLPGPASFQLSPKCLQTSHTTTIPFYWNLFAGNRRYFIFICAHSFLRAFLRDVPFQVSIFT